MTRAEALAKGRLELASSPSAPLDASLLLASVLGIGREALFAEPGLELSEGAAERYADALILRARGRPIAYIVGEKEFYGRSFEVGPAVLVPRPDTELLVELALSFGDRRAALAGRPPRIHECCVGSGAVAISLAAERPTWAISASDISPEALETAARNASRHVEAGRPGGGLELFRADLLDGPLFDAMAGRLDLILANPPYVEAELARELAERWGEPLIALDGGPDGLDLARLLVPRAASLLARGGALLVEADGAQAATLRELFRDASLIDVRSEVDLAGIERCTVGVKP